MVNLFTARRATFRDEQAANRTVPWMRRRHFALAVLALGAMSVLATSGPVSAQERRATHATVNIEAVPNAAGALLLEHDPKAVIRGLINGTGATATGEYRDGTLRATITIADLGRVDTATLGKLGITYEHGQHTTVRLNLGTLNQELRGVLASHTTTVTVTVPRRASVTKGDGHTDSGTEGTTWNVTFDLDDTATHELTTKINTYRITFGQVLASIGALLAGLGLTGGMLWGAFTLADRNH